MTCSKGLIDSASHELRGVRLKLSECLVVLREEDTGHDKVVMALSFIQLALDALLGFQSERDTAGQP
jgi:hypothetical protein